MKDDYQYRECFFWPSNHASRSTDHLGSKSYHSNCFPECPGYNRFQKTVGKVQGNLPPKRAATLAETLRALYVYKKLELKTIEERAKEKSKWKISQVDTNLIAKLNSGSFLNNQRLQDYWNALPSLPSLYESMYSNGGIGPDKDHLQFQDMPTQLSVAVRPFNFDAALQGVPAMPDATIPGPGPVVCGYNGPGKLTLIPLCAFHLQVYHLGAPRCMNKTPIVGLNAPPLNPVADLNAPPVAGLSARPVADLNAPPVAGLDAPPIAGSDPPPIAGSDPAPIAGSDAPPIAGLDSPTSASLDIPPSNFAPRLDTPPLPGGLDAPTLNSGQYG